MSAAIVAAFIILQNSENYPMTSTKTPKPRSTKSKTVLVALIVFALALAGGIAAIFTPAVAALAIVVALVATGLCVLSLREDL